MVPGGLDPQPVTALPGAVPPSFETRVAHERQQRRAMSFWIVYFMAMLLAFPVLCAMGIRGVPLLHQTQAWFILVLCTLPVVLHLTKREAGLPVFPIICLVYSSSYALPVFFVKPTVVAMSSITGIVTVPEAQVTAALWFTIIGVFSMQVGFWFFRFSLLQLVVPRIRMPLQVDHSQRLVTVLGGIGLLLLWANITNRFVVPNSLFYISVLVIKQASMCVALLYLYSTRGQLTPRMKIIFALVVVFFEILGLSTGNLRSIMDPLVAISAVYWMTKRRFPVVFVTIAALLFVVMQPIKALYRMKVWGEGYASTSVTDRLFLWGDLLSTSFKNRHVGKKMKETSTHNALLRADLIHTFARVVQMTPRNVPFQYGTTYSYLLYALVPRALWPGKPMGQSVNQFFGVSYDFQTKDSVGDTSIGAPHLAEAFLNFGAFGVIFVMMIIGMVYAAVDRLFNHPDAGEGGIATYAVILTDLWTIETATAPTFGGIIQSVLVYTLILTLVRKKEPRKIAPVIRAPLQAA